MLWPRLHHTQGVNNCFRLLTLGFARTCFGLSVRPSACLSVCLFVCLFACLSFHALGITGVCNGAVCSPLVCAAPGHARRGGVCSCCRLLTARVQAVDIVSYPTTSVAFHSMFNRRRMSMHARLLFYVCPRAAQNSLRYPRASVVSTVCSAMGACSWHVSFLFS